MAINKFHSPQAALRSNLLRVVGLFLMLTGPVSAAPVINSVSGEAPTEGGTTITILGEAFGFAPTVTLDGLPVTLASPPIEFIITFILPAGEGTNIPLRVTDDFGAFDEIPFSYNRPTITSTTGSAPTAGAAA